MYEDGFAFFQHNQWKDAADKLAAAIAVSRGNATLLVDEMSHRDTWVRGLIALAMSRHRLKDRAGEDEANDDLARTYPNQTILIQSLSGSESTRLYTRALSRLEAEGRGRLIVDVREQAARLYLDADERPQNESLEADVLPGLHRIVARMPGTDGQLYEVNVEPGKTTTLSIDLKFGDTLRITEGYAGLVFLSQADRDQYALDYAGQLAAGSMRVPRWFSLNARPGTDSRRSGASSTWPIPACGCAGVSRHWMGETMISGCVRSLVKPVGFRIVVAPVIVQKIVARCQLGGGSQRGSVRRPRVE